MGATRITKQAAATTLEDSTRALKTNGQRALAADGKVAQALLKKAESASAATASREAALENGARQMQDGGALRETAAPQDDMPLDADADADDAAPVPETPPKKKAAAVAARKPAGGAPTRFQLHKQGTAECDEIVYDLKQNLIWTENARAVGVVVLIDLFRAWQLEDEAERQKLLPSESKESTSLLRGLFAGRFNDDVELHTVGEAVLTVGNARTAVREISGVLEKALAFAQTHNPELKHLIQDVLNGVTAVQKSPEQEFALPVRCTILGIDVNDALDACAVDAVGWFDGKPLAKKFFVSRKLYELVEAIVTAQTFWHAVAQIALGRAHIASNHVKFGSTKRRDAIDAIAFKDGAVKDALCPKTVFTLSKLLPLLYGSINKIDTVRKALAPDAGKKKVAAPLTELEDDARDDDRELTEQPGVVDVFTAPDMALDDE